MKLKWYDVDFEHTKMYEAQIWESGNICILDEYYTTKSEAVKAVKTVKKNYKGNSEIDCYVRFFDYKSDTVRDFNL